MNLPVSLLCHWNPLLLWLTRACSYLQLPLLPTADKCPHYSSSFPPCQPPCLQSFHSSLCSTPPGQWFFLPSPCMAQLRFTLLYMLPNVPASDYALPAASSGQSSLGPFTLHDSAQHGMLEHTCDSKQSQARSLQIYFLPTPPHSGFGHVSPSHT